MKKLFKTLLILLLFIPYLHTASQIHAASVTSFGIATYLPVNGKNIEDGDIIVATQKGYYKSSIAYDPQIAGVITMKPAIVLRLKLQKGGYPVVNVGTVKVKVTGSNGDIKRGDFIVTSAIPGTGMKATKSGYVLGEALEDANLTNMNDTKLISVSLNMHFLQLGSPIKNSLLDIFSLSRIATYEQPIRVLQYVVAGIIVIASFTFGFLIFARAINTGIEALGRNPLAGRMIQLSIVFNVILIIIIVIAGVSLAVLIVRL